MTGNVHLALEQGDFVLFWDDAFGHHRFYLVEGCHYGAEGQVSIITLRSLTERSGRVGPVKVDTLLVPEPLLRGKRVLRAVGPEKKE